MTSRAAGHPNGGPRLFYVITEVEKAASLLQGQLGYMKLEGFEVHLVSSPSTALDQLGAVEGVHVHPLRIERNPSPVSDIAAFIGLRRLIRVHRPAIVNASTPKAGFLGVLAARSVGVPHVVFVARTIRSETLTGVARWLTRQSERLSIALAHSVVAISASLMSRARQLGLDPHRKMQVLGPGSSNGVDPSRFWSTREDADVLRAELGIGPDELVLGFVGRLAADKGLADYRQVIETVRGSGKPVRGLVVGDLDEADPIDAATWTWLSTSSEVVRIGRTDPAPYYPCMDLFVFPSRREGFGNVLLEAASAGVPSVAYRTMGVIDAVEDGVTGRLVPPGDVAALASAALDVLADDVYRASVCIAGPAHARRFDRERIWAAIVEAYRASPRLRQTRAH